MFFFPNPFFWGDGLIFYVESQIYFVDPISKKTTQKHIFLKGDQRGHSQKTYQKNSHPNYKKRQKTIQGLVSRRLKFLGPKKNQGEA